MSIQEQLKLSQELSKILAESQALEKRRAKVVKALAASLDGGIDEAAAIPTPALEVEPDPTPKEPGKELDDALNLYDATYERRTDSQMRMIFGLLNKEHGIKDEVEQKAVIVGITAKLHEGEIIGSTKDLSKQWAGDIIDYLQKHSTEEVKTFLIPF
jgi:hypothetical protein